MVFIPLAGLGITVAIVLVIYSKFMAGPTEKTRTSPGEPGHSDSGYKGPFRYECESCRTVLSDDLDIRATNTGYECHHCGHELNDQDGAETVWV
jgi:DNA-directed RNA polymerase subunit RPC12/RpoP